jgi:predicted enzyme related to lactoylglutathione lyase
VLIQGQTLVTSAADVSSFVGRGTARVYDRRMLRAVHTLIYSDDPQATRAFLRDVLGWPYLEDASSEPGWLIFKTGPSELGVHPTSGTWEGEEFSHPRQHTVSLVCDDIARTRAELEAKGATFSTEIEDFGFGLGTTLELPGAGGILLYEPRHPTAYDL